MTAKLLLWTDPSTTHDLPLATVLDRLKQRDEVDGIILAGSTSGDALTPHSDYDIIVMLNTIPGPINVAYTTIDGRLADIVFVTTEDAQSALDLQPLSEYDRRGHLFYWLRTGEIVFDRLSLLAQLRALPWSEDWINITSHEDIYRTWFRINYNLKHAQRMVTSGDPVYLMALDVRLLYSLLEVWMAYFRLRRIAWRGEKSAVRYLQEHDPEFLAQFQEALHTADRARKVTLYAALAARALESTGPIWPDNATAVDFHGNQPFDAATDYLPAQHFWNRLVSAPDTPP